VHRNTLRYRLSKIALITGRDWRTPISGSSWSSPAGVAVLQALEEG